jgi:hypothetical protein
MRHPVDGRIRQFPKIENHDWNLARKGASTDGFIQAKAHVSQRSNSFKIIVRHRSFEGAPQRVAGLRRSGPS